MSDRIPVIVTTQHRGVFFGFADLEDIENREKITLTKVRNVLYWSRDTGGFLGLAGNGPTSQCRIGREAPEVVLHDITSCTKTTYAAAEAFGKAVWS